MLVSGLENGVLMPRVLRAIAGLPIGATFPVQGRTSIGRAPDSDVQLMHPGVSRHHAKLEVGEDGSVMLVDLVSRAGTSVDGTLVERVLLRHGAVIAIGGFAMRFEEVAQADVPGPRAPRHAGLAALRVTAAFQRARVSTTAATAAAATAVPTDAVRPEPVAVPSLGSLSPSALVSAVHRLRTEITTSVPGPQDRFFRTDVAPGRRRYPRFACPIQAWVARHEGSRLATAPVDLGDLGVGGARFSWRAEAPKLGTAPWLIVDLDNEDDAPLIVLPARVAWVAHDRPAAGLEFVGAGARGLDALELIDALVARV